jgi:hypothetical protein
MRFHVRSGDRELVFPSFRDFQAMYRQGFVAPDDLVRRENGTRWAKARDLPELRSVHLYERGGTHRALTTALWLMLGLFAAAVVLQLFLMRPGRP